MESSTKTGARHPHSGKTRKRGCGSDLNKLELKCSKFRSELRTSVLQRGRQQLNRIYGTDVKSIDTTGLGCRDLLSAVKEWMEGDEVRVAFRRKGRREREGGKFAFRLLKKILPAPCKCFGSNADAWVKRQTVAVTQDWPTGFREFVVKELNRMFPARWDRGYVDSIGRYAPNTSACVENPCSKGGSRKEVSLDAYLSWVIGESQIPQGPLKYTEVLTAGKIRPLTIAPASMNALRPLHKLIFDRVTRQRWCLTGPPSPEKFRRAGFRFKHGILSGDYKGATDGLDLRVSTLILSEILSRAEIVPPLVKGAALASLRPQVIVDGVTHQVERGQMMGSLLSFPLLCLYNYLATKFALGNVPVLINGDDVVAETRSPHKWFGVLPLLGLEPEQSKTGYSERRLEINSTPFIVKGGVPIAAPVARVRVLAPRGETGMGLGAQFDAFLFNLGPLADRAADVFLKSKRPLIYRHLSSGVTLPDLGFRGPTAVAALGRNGYINLATKLAKLLPGQVPLSSLISMPPTLTATRAVHGKVPDHIRRKSNTLITGDLFGTSRGDYSTTAALREYYERFEEVGFKPLRPLSSDIVSIKASTVSLFRTPYLDGLRVYRHSTEGGRMAKPWVANWLCGPTRARFYGELVTFSVFKRRLLNGLECCDTMSPQRVSLALFHLVPPSIVWGINSSAWVTVGTCPG